MDDVSLSISVDNPFHYKDHMISIEKDGCFLSGKEVEGTINIEFKLRQFLGTQVLLLPNNSFAQTRMKQRNQSNIH